MELDFAEMVLGFNILMAVVFFALVIFIAVMRFNVLYMRFLSYVLAIFAVSRLAAHALMFDLPPTAHLGVSLFYAFILCALPFTMLLTIMALTGHLERSPGLDVKVSIVSVTTSLLFAAAVALAWPWPWLVSLLLNLITAIIFSVLLGSTYLLFVALRKGSGDRKKNLILLAFVLTNLIGYPALEFLEGQKGMSLSSLALESVLLGINILLMGFFILYIVPQASMEESYKALKGEFDDLMRYAGDGIAILDERGRIVSSNIAFRGLVGSSAEDPKGQRLLDLVPKGQAEAVKRAIARSYSGEVAKDISHNFIAKGGPKGKGGLSNHVVSTFSPIKLGDGKVAGSLLITRDTTPIKQLEVERALRARSEAQNQLQKFMTGLMPVLLAGASGMEGGNKAVYLNLLLNNVEKALSWEGPAQDNGHTNGGKNCAPTVQDHLCNIMNTLGGSFYWEQIGNGDGADEGSLAFYSIDCPWGEEARKNPMFCNLCRGIFTRLILRVDGKASIDLLETIANNEPRCRIVVSGLGKGKQSGNKGPAGGLGAAASKEGAT